MNQMSDSVTEYRALTGADWLAYESSLKGLLRVREPVLLARYATEAATTLHQIQILILHRAWRWPLQYLPLMLCRGPALDGENPPAGAIRWVEPADAVIIAPRKQHGSETHYPRQFGNRLSLAGTTEAKN